MSEEQEANAVNFTVNTEDLYREESVTDMKVGTIRQFVPIKLDGTSDEGRPTRFVGHTQLMSPQGPMPVHAQLEAETLEAAVGAFPTAMEASLKEMIERIQQMQQEQKTSQPEESRIIMPGQ